MIYRQFRVLLFIVFSFFLSIKPVRYKNMITVIRTDVDNKLGSLISILAGKIGWEKIFAELTKEGVEDLINDMESLEEQKKDRMKFAIKEKVLKILKLYKYEIGESEEQNYGKKEEINYHEYDIIFDAEEFFEGKNEISIFKKKEKNNKEIGNNKGIMHGLLSFFSQQDPRELNDFFRFIKKISDHVGEDQYRQVIISILNKSEIDQKAEGMYSFFTSAKEISSSKINLDKSHVEDFLSRVELVKKT